MDNGLLKKVVKDYMHEDYIAIPEDYSVEEALEIIREIKDENKIVYYYTVNCEGQLTGVLPVRRLITSQPERKVSEIAESGIVTICEDEKIIDAAKKFSNYKYMSMPVVNKNGILEGVIDLRTFAGKEIEVGNKSSVDEIFSTIGVRVSKYRNASPFKAFTYRYPWLLSTVTSGVACAVLTSFFKLTLEKSIILTFFLTLILGLGESVSMQSMTLSFQELNIKGERLKRYLATVKKELLVAIQLGIAYGVIVFIISYLIGRKLDISLVIYITIFLEMISACMIGTIIPFLLHYLKLDPKISAGPIVLAMTDTATLAIYLITAAEIIR